MIFVVVGTQRNSFDRLINSLSALPNSHDLYVQYGHYRGEKLYPGREFISKAKMNSLYKSADIIICHSGVGSLLDAVRYNGRVITFPRLMEYGESVSSQIEAAKYFSDVFNVEICTNEKELAGLVEEKLKQTALPNSKYKSKLGIPLASEVINDFLKLNV